MKNHLITLFFLLSAAIIATRCSRIYDPRLDIPGEILVVEAHMTDMPETYFVKLSITSPFNSSTINTPVTGARVWVINNKDNSLQQYAETGQGYYSFTPGAENTGITGDSYTLHIETSDGNIYESSPELMSSRIIVDSVYGIKKNRTALIQPPDGGSLIPTTNSYIDITADIETGLKSTPEVRFEPGWIFEMIDYHRDITGGPPVPPTYSWTYTTDNSLYISDETNNYILKGQYAGSLLIDNLAQMYSTQNLDYIILIMNFYGLNNDSYSFYSEMEKQLSANDALFDPIAEQITGNIKCLNNPGKQVKGLFDVASHEVSVFFVNPNNKNSPPSIEQTGNSWGLPVVPEGKTDGIPPEWWFQP